MERGSGKLRRSGTIIFDDLAFKLTPSERIIFGIIHRFSGYNLGECRLKPNKIADLAGVSRSTVYNCTNKLIEFGMIELMIHEKNSGAKFRALRVIKDRLGDDHIERADVIEAAEKQNMSNSSHEPRNYSTAAKKIEHGDSEVNELIQYWIETTSLPIESRVKANRRAAWNLKSKHGSDQVKVLVQIAARAKYDDFAPRVADFVDLQSKSGQLILWAEKKANESMMAKFEKMSIEDRVKFKRENPKFANIIKQKRKVM